MGRSPAIHIRRRRWDSKTAATAHGYTGPSTKAVTNAVGSQDLNRFGLAVFL